MTFTDEDLKRLKDAVEDELNCNELISYRLEIRDLIARLEAAELVFAETDLTSFHNDWCESDDCNEGNICDIQFRINTWRKAAGKCA